MKYLKRHWPIPAIFLGAVGLLGLIAGSLGGWPGFSVFNTTATPANPTVVGSGTFTVALGGGGSSGSFSQTVSNMAPGDFYEVEGTITNTGTVGISAVDLSAVISSLSPSTAPLFAGDSSSVGLQVYGQVCPSGSSWQSATSGSATVYSCSSSATPITLFGAPVSLASLTAVGSTLTPPSGSTTYVPQVSGAGNGSSDTSSLATSSSSSDGLLMNLPASNNASGVSEVIAPGQSVDVVITGYLPPQADNTYQGNTGTVTYTFTAVQRGGEAK